MGTRAGIGLAGIFLVPVLGADPIVTAGGPGAEFINARWEAGKCAGLEGVFYENRDAGHSVISLAQYPQVKAWPFTKEELEANAHKGPARGIRSGGIVIGNASMAANVTHGGSIPRQYFGHRQGLAFLHAQYFFQPDFRLSRAPRPRSRRQRSRGIRGSFSGQRRPYLLISQGSSGSDRVFLHALMQTLAAMPQNVRRELEARRAIAPTLQAILRRNYAEEYFSGAAHPVVFDGPALDPEAMVRDAANLTLESLPPLVQLAVTDADLAVNGRDFFEPEGVGEILGESSCSIARVFRSTEQNRTLKVSARGSRDLTGARLRYDWVVLRGDPKAVDFEIAEDTGSATITIRHQDPRRIQPGLPGGRIDIGVFASNGKATSAPAIISCYCLPNEARRYDPAGRVLEVNYRARAGSFGVVPPDADLHMPLLLGLGSGSVAAYLPLEEALGVEVIGALSQRGAALKAGWEDLLKQRRELQNQEDQLNAAVNDALTAVKAVEAAGDPEELAKAKARQQLAEKKRHEAAPELKAQRESLAKAKSDIDQALGNPLGNIGALADVLGEGIDRLAEGPALDRRHPKLVASLMAGPAKGKKGAWGQLRGRTQGPRSGEFRPRHSRGQSLPPRPTWVYPELVSGNPATSNYCDPNLAAPKFWRDVYGYDADGQCLGWTRYGIEGVQHFNAKGDLLIGGPTGLRGRAVRVDYRYDPGRKSLVAVPRNP